MTPDPDRAVILMADYSADPLWWAIDGSNENLDRFPLSDTLHRRLRAWADRFESTEPTATRDGGLRYFASDDDSRDFDIEGVRLAAEVARELGEGWSVTYHSHLRAERDLPGR